MSNAMSNAVVLRAENLGKIYQEGDLKTPVFSNLDLTVYAGETVSIVGASGAGKSTLLHLLGGLDTPTSGEVFIGSQAVSKLSESARGQLRNRSLGFVYQFHHLLPEFTAIENVMMPLLIGGVAVLQAKKESQALLDRVGLSHRLNHKPGELSGGERQRAAVARALVTKPACILGDEPTGNLDDKNTQSVFDLLLELNREHGTSLVLVTHEHDLAKRCDRMLELTQGRLFQVASSS
jgi:lipoprotein-releasing system ATP-binding protein